MDDFFDDFDESDFVDDDSFEDSSDENLEAEDSFDDEPKMGDEPDEADLNENGFTSKDAFFFGGAMGWASEEGLEEAERRKLEKKMDLYYL